MTVSEGAAKTPSGSAPAPGFQAESRPLYKRVLPFLVAAALLTYVFHKLDFKAFVEALKHLNYAGYAAFTIAWSLAVCGGDTLGTVAAYRLTTPSVRYGEFYLMRAASYLPGIANHHLGQAFLTYLMSRFFRVPLKRMAGATLLSYASWVGCLLGCMVIALPFTNLPKFYIPLIAGAGVVYLLIIGFAPARLARISFLAPLFEAGLVGHAKALAARVPHLLVLVLGAWVSLLFFHIDIPLGTALVYMPILLVAVTLPITIQGAGTRDAVAQGFFLAFAPGVTDGEKAANIAAGTMCWTISNTIMCAVMGIICSRIISRRLALLPVEVELQSPGGPPPDESPRSGVV